MRTGLYMLVNAVTAAIWAVGIGLAAYFIGPSVVDAVGDLGTATEISLVVLVVVGVVLEIRRRRRRQARRDRSARERQPPPRETGDA